MLAKRAERVLRELIADDTVGPHRIAGGAQVGMTLNQFVEHRVDRVLLGCGPLCFRCWTFLLGHVELHGSPG